MSPLPPEHLTASPWSPCVTCGTMLVSQRKCPRCHNTPSRASLLTWSGGPFVPAPNIFRTAKGTATAGPGNSITIANVTIAAGATLLVGTGDPYFNLTNPPAVTFNGAALTRDVYGGAAPGIGINAGLHRLYSAAGDTGSIVATWSSAPGGMQMFASEYVGLNINALNRVVTAGANNTIWIATIPGSPLANNSLLIAAIETGANVNKPSGAVIQDCVIGQHTGDAFLSLTEVYRIDSILRGTRTIGTTNNPNAPWGIAAADYSGTP